MADLQNIGGLWKRQSKASGNTFLGGEVELGGVKHNIMVFPNKKKKNEKEPDYRIVTTGQSDNQPVKQESQESQEPDFFA